MSDTAVEASASGAADGAVDTAGTDERLTFRGPFQRLLTQPEIGALIGAIAIWGFFWAVTRPFGTAGGTANWLDVAATLGITAVVVAMLMIGGEFDLSAGAMTGATGIMLILLVKDIGELGGLGLNLFVAIPLSFIVALAIGWFNGTVVEKTSLPSFIVTLGTFFALKGVKLGFAKLLIDNIQVGRVDEGTGYEFWRRVFASTWARNDHQFEGRDVVYNQLLLLGVVLFVLAFFDMAFVHRRRSDTRWLPVVFGGAALAVAGYVLLHVRNGGDMFFGVLVGAGVIVAVGAWGKYRYEPRTSSDLIRPSVAIQTLIGGGVVSLVIAVITAIIFDAESSVSLREIIADDPLKAIYLTVLAAVAVALGALWASRSGHRTALVRTLSALAVIGVLIAILLLLSDETVREARIDFLTSLLLFTEQGIRAILFVGLVAIGLIAMAMGAVRAGATSIPVRSFVQSSIALAVVAIAFFVQNQSASRKFRAELFTVMLLLALVVFCWSIVSLLAAERSAPDAKADRIGRLTMTVGVVLIVLAVVVRLLFTTTAEIEDGVPPALFSVRIVWFIAVTAAAVWALARTKFGNWTFAVGGNKEAARQVGVPAARTKTQLFMVVSAGAWLVGMLLTFRLTTLQASTGDGNEFEYIIAAVVGGNLLTGGYGSALGAAIGALIMAMSGQGIPFAGWNSDWRFVFLGGILLLAVIANNFIRSRAEAVRK